MSFLFNVTLSQRKGELNHNLIVVKSKGRKLLNTNYVNYSYGALQLLLNSFLKELALEYTDFKPQKTLVLGLGGGSVFHLLKEHYPETYITVVEKDIAVIELAYSVFNLNKEFDFDLHYGDAYDFVATNSQKFDLIINDIFVDDTVPETIKSIEYLENLKKLLAPKGVIAFNKMEKIEDKGQSYEVFKGRFSSVFPESKDFQKEYYERKSHLLYNRIS